MRTSELRARSSSELRQDILDVQQELMNLRFQQQESQRSDSSLLKKLRRDIARMKTVLRERELFGQP